MSLLRDFAYQLEKQTSSDIRPCLSTIRICTRLCVSPTLKYQSNFLWIFCYRIFHYLCFVSCIVSAKNQDTICWRKSTKVHRNWTMVTSFVWESVCVCVSRLWGMKSRSANSLSAIPANNTNTFSNYIWHHNYLIKVVRLKSTSPHAPPPPHHSLTFLARESTQLLLYGKVIVNYIDGGRWMRFMCVWERGVEDAIENV